jgi:hypothetical protein
MKERPWRAALPSMPHRLLRADEEFFSRFRRKAAEEQRRIPQAELAVANVGNHAQSKRRAADQNFVSVYAVDILP